MDQSQPVLKKKSRSVSFDEDKNEVQEFPRVAAEDKANVWMTRLQIRQNKMEAQEELMMEKTRALVKAKLVEEAALSEAKDEEELLRKVQVLQQQLDDIMRRPKQEILAFLQTRYNWITDCNDFWKDLPPHIQQAASVLGYTQELWDEFSQQLELFKLPWKSLKPTQQEAAQTLGYNEMTWNGSLEVDSAAMTMVEDDEPQAVVVEMDDDENKDADPMYEWGANNDSSSSSTSSPKNNESDSSSSNSSQDQMMQDEDADPENDVNEMEYAYDWGETEKAKDEDSPDEPRRSAIDMYMAKFFPEEENNAPDDDEEEFISNFLADDKSADDGPRRRSLLDRYVPSDDEMDLDVDDEDDESLDGKDATKETPSASNGVEKESRSTPLLSGTTPIHYQTMEERDGHAEETSPLLGGEQEDPKKSGLFRRFLGSASTDSSGLDVPDADDDDDDLKRPDDGGGRKFGPLSAPAAILIVLGLLTLGWIVTRRGTSR